MRARSELKLEIGYVYILTNEYLPGLLKIGMTTRTPEDRAVEISKTGVPGKWYVHYYLFVPNCTKIEKSVHQALHTFRVDINREFFKVEMDYAINVINEHGFKLINHFPGWPNMENVKQFIEIELNKIKEEEARRVAATRLEKQVWLVKLEQDKKENETRIKEERIQRDEAYLKHTDTYTKEIINESYLGWYLLVPAILALQLFSKSESSNALGVLFWLDLIYIYWLIHDKKNEKNKAVVLRREKGLPEI